MKTLKELGIAIKAASDANDQELIRKLTVEIVDAIALEMKPEAEEIVAKLEGDKLKTTRHNYGRYMALLSGFPAGIERIGFVKALKNAGAGQGLEDAVRLVMGR